MISDFLDKGFEGALKRTGQRHDLIGLALSDPSELSLPPVGLVELEDAETGQVALIDTSARGFQEALQRKTNARLDALRLFAHSSRVDLIELSTEGNHLEALTRFFHLRERRLGRR